MSKPDLSITAFAPGGLRPKAGKAESAFHSMRSSSALSQSQRGLMEMDKWLSEFREIEITVAGTAYTVLARNQYGGEADATTYTGALQIVTRATSATTYNIGITPGIVGYAAGSVIPTIQPAGVSLGGAAAYWWTNNVDGTGITGLFIYLKLLLDDTDDYDGALLTAEVHLLTAEPVTIFSAGVYQYVHIGSVWPDGAGLAVATSHILGSLRTLRRGGPGCPYDIYAP